MTAYLLDTNIISKLAPGKAPASDPVQAWFHEQGEADSLFLSALSVAEIEKGMRSLHRRGGIERAKRLSTWLDVITESFGDRILPMDTVVARIVGVLEDEAESHGRHPGLGDLIIAATARAYDLTVITENLRHFQPLDVAVDLPAAFRSE
ncbi:type II toxin-antitoxin system VapC family toxin [Rhizobium leguminosarum]|uniref:Ribonuclease VapC n=1 Tax=Rhizobium johnstonii (strain DSM 114642 / LMG 32736 / 3841) TaxID=216596 RepID=Q1MK99_RHIJ3|nr:MULTISPECIES: type II toxin-antitoxin system VapC family toxin [Rhizobium]NKL20702.1 PIN domain-containing protein [Rhizobium leguminosarum bv. viciae]NEI96102.1 PIN domain-containing protein [Rhizobium leguminosarum]NEJ79103.1 PIN domain-containing protein [Rhizobium leguminosarum]TBF39262.1 type II toxin-antitoxin system VapC family toxin [Rhizobium leguminosarum]TBF50963.1 type II toxin-antitoxin system VapC family toxin [Rhizobium leguminosarum]